MAAPPGSSGAPSWLFSFVDLAFLMLIAMTQLANPGAVDLGELIVPRIASERTEAVAGAVSQGWQLRVHPPEPGVGVFELVRGDHATLGSAPRLDAEQLGTRLDEMAAAGVDKPALAPHEESRSRDLLEAVASLEAHWPHRRRALVERVVAHR